MQLYRFSPILEEQTLYQAIEHIHLMGYKLCHQSFNTKPANSGNIGIFCHYESEYEYLISVRNKLCLPSDNPNLKYYELKVPIVINATADIPETIYTHLYIRRPDPYRAHVGDMDFYLKEVNYKELKTRLQQGEKIKCARLFERPDLDMVELYDADIDVLAYVSTDQMTKKVRIKQSDYTKL